MRTILFYDLPSVTSKDNREYRKFVKFIKMIGFIMLQESVYVKMTLNSSMAESVVKLVKRNKPKEGNIILLTITEKQFSNMDIILGELKDNNIITTSEKTIIL